MSKRITRRKFVRKGLTGLGGLAAGGALATHGWAAGNSPLGYIGAKGQQGRQASETSEPIDAIIIGSGFERCRRGAAAGRGRRAHACVGAGTALGDPGSEQPECVRDGPQPRWALDLASPVTVLGEMPPKQIDIYTGVLDASIENGIIVSRGAEWVAAHSSMRRS